ncbi:MAG: hypothetical protein IT463_04870 [Planctomycetes bacterium]|nr:hypothetical protein [Planctomycetota bacterium]
MNQRPVVKRPLQYVIRCASCNGEVVIAPAELENSLAVCPHCGLPQATPVFALLSGRKPPAKPE